MVAGDDVLGFCMMAMSGILLASQSGINLTLGKAVGKSFASVVSFTTGLLVLGVFFAIDYGALHSKGPTVEGIKSTPWWSWIGGPMGAFYVASVIIFAPKLGAGNTISMFVAAQLITALILDSKGWLGYQQRGFHWARALGVVLLIAGLILVARFDGNQNKGKTPPASSAASSASSAASSSADLAAIEGAAGLGKGLQDGSSVAIDMAMAAAGQLEMTAANHGSKKGADASNKTGDTAGASNSSSSSQGAEAGMSGTDASTQPSGIAAVAAPGTPQQPASPVSKGTVVIGGRKLLDA